MLISFISFLCGYSFSQASPIKPSLRRKEIFSILSMCRFRISNESNSSFIPPILGFSLLRFEWMVNTTHYLSINLEKLTKDEVYGLIYLRTVNHSTASRASQHSPTSPTQSVSLNQTSNSISLLSVHRSTRRLVIDPVSFLVPYFPA